MVVQNGGVLTRWAGDVGLSDRSSYDQCFGTNGHRRDAGDRSCVGATGDPFLGSGESVDSANGMCYMYSTPFTGSVCFCTIC